jgi:alginate O-acetyltransferase complex protein AlgJ
MTAASTSIGSEHRQDHIPPHGAPSSRGTLARIFAAAFLLALFIPLAGTALHWDSGNASNENRRLVAIPDLPKNVKQATHYSDQWLDFYRDHFGFRNALIHAVALTRLHGFGQEMDGNVVVGKDGWLFLRPDGDHDFIAYRGLNPLTDAELDGWQNVLEKRQAFLASLGIPYLVVVPPDKQTIYPEYLPPEYQVVRHESRLDQLINRLKSTNSPVQIIDLRSALLAAKPEDQLYHKTDTHWNDFGAFVGYQVIMKAVQQALPKWHIIPQSRDDFVASPVVPEVGDLARMMDAPEQFPDAGSYWVRKIPFPIPPSLVNRNEIAAMDLNDPARPNLILYRDSFSIALVPMIGPNFNRTVYAFKYEMDPKTIRSEKPDLVITEFLERNLYIAPPTDAAELRDWKLH